MKKIKLFIVSILIILNSATLIADDFNDWKVKFKKRAIKEVIKGLGKAVKAHTKQKKMLEGAIREESNTRSSKT